MRDWLCGDVSGTAMCCIVIVVSSSRCLRAFLTRTLPCGLVAMLLYVNHPPLIHELPQMRSASSWGVLGVLVLAAAVPGEH